MLSGSWSRRPASADREPHRRVLPWSNQLAIACTDRGRSMGAQWNDGRRFEGRVAVVTAGGGTLGGAVARGFGLEGASVAIGYRSSRSQAGEVVAELEGR